MRRSNPGVIKMDILAKQLLIIRKAAHCAEPFPLTDKISVSVDRNGNLEYYRKGVYNTLAELQAEHPDCSVRDKDIQDLQNRLSEYFDEEDGTNRCIFVENFLEKLQDDGEYYFEDCIVILKGNDVTIKRY